MISFYAIKASIVQFLHFDVFFLGFHVRLTSFPVRITFLPHLCQLNLWVVANYHSCKYKLVECFDLLFFIAINVMQC